MKNLLFWIFVISVPLILLFFQSESNYYKYSVSIDDVRRITDRITSFISGNESRIIGDWYNTDNGMYYLFNKDGSLIITDKNKPLPYTYAITDDILTIKGLMLVDTYDMNWINSNEFKIKHRNKAYVNQTLHRQ